MERAFPDIKAVDPYNCGCTECLVGEYIPEGRWADKANAADLAAVLSGEVRDNTYSWPEGGYSLIMSTVFTMPSAKEFVRKLQEELTEIAKHLDTQEIVDSVSWMDE